LNSRGDSQVVPGAGFAAAHRRVRGVSTVTA